MPAAFPEVTGYRIYDKDRVFGTVDAAITEYVGKIQTGVSYSFEVTASYGSIESEKSKTETIFVGIDNIEDVTTVYPTAFSNYVLLKVSGTVARVDVISVSGKGCLAVDNPGDVIDTSSLSPGLYFFRLYDGNNRILKVVRAVKTS